MITPVVSNATWLTELARLPQWLPPAVPTLVLAPHPDDETLGAGALIATLRADNVPVTVVAATDGENCYNVSPAERETIRRTREEEQAEALGRLGVPRQSLVRFRMTDSGLHLQEAELTARLLAVAEPGMHLVAPWIGDFHPDHIACAHAAAAVAAEKQLQLTWYFFWTWHRGTADVLDGIPAVRLVPDPIALQAKADALQFHRSQLAWNGEAPILPQNLLGPAHWPFEVFLPA